ncbi:GNAT family N-acetyltransferase [Bifidobacterium vespertilionis]|uniref:N-acetyltransferase family protein n=1 Tax=Bifidobacterium vespertilionis TaxID=2562524 RepID=A0A5J5DYU2_9BIFI|nr:GNAT family N-acetyltransferase [Bifidobacterium vespertilionis]KAA8821679.1 N-acetyltransferase family protein [Bifidobacterium vespertilionis]KAA8824759.1 N-acetyltransferase family protein [Bifidobacterium vespertilionis]
MPNSPYRIRPAESDDVAAIARIYNAAVEAGGSTADLESQTLEQRRAWVESHKPPYVVAVIEDAAAAEGDDPVIGFGALSVFYDRPGYDGVTDLAYYIAPEAQGGGAGTAMLDWLLAAARERNMRKAIGIIFADNAGSVALMRRFGFTQFGLLPAAATDATGKMHDMSYWYLEL